MLGVWALSAIPLRDGAKGSKTYEVLAQRSEAWYLIRVSGRTSCPLAEALRGRANVDMSLLAQDRTEEFDPGSD